MNSCIVCNSKLPLIYVGTSDDMFNGIDDIYECVSYKSTFTVNRNIEIYDHEKEKSKSD